MKPESAFLALSNPPSIQILSWLRKNEKSFLIPGACINDNFGVCLESLQYHLGWSSEFLRQNLSLLQEAGLIKVKLLENQTYYCRHEINLNFLRDILAKPITEKQSHVLDLIDSDSSFNFH